MAFKNLRVTIVKVEGKCTRSKVGTVFFIRNACLEIPHGQSVCIFALGSILQPLSAAIMKTEQNEGILDTLQEWQCPDPLAKVIFKIEEETKTSHTCNQPRCCQNHNLHP
ncbi:MAG: TIGR04076 family protein [Thermoproteales archaeon]|nr:TIGR04076 family protein [Thermoproteales archaeon]